MLIPPHIIAHLRKGHPVAAELPAHGQNMKAYVMILPVVPLPHEQPELWHPVADRLNPFPLGFTLKSVESIKGYEIRYLLHHAKYTDEAWGFDYDYVLDDATTRVKRIFVDREDALGKALTPWLSDLSKLRDTRAFASSLVNSPIDYYLNRPNERPHLGLG